ncbi:hypothetical protein DBV15_11663 [Temnothorax longispinosus]|uniref:Uncharacterized protein n=1 Tax=Temnothorax longispinosus TaxID=300112 RepID=A0A4S2KEL1_9HYME|nr:hypothetical protein DBV15_11663 [Temnothorax longispinosus]
MNISRSAKSTKDPHSFAHYQLIYVRAWFPCQDAPSVKFTCSGKVQKPFNVLMSALSQGMRKGPKLDVYEFRKEIPSYAGVIAVGSLCGQKNLIKQ